MALINHWRSTYNKDDLKFYANEAFQDDYTEQELPKKQEMVRSLIYKPLKSAIMSTDYGSYKVLSLGCGPGSDLLAVMEVFQSVCQSEELGSLRVKCFGVDLFHWPLEEFARRAADIEDEGPIDTFSNKFWYGQDMEDFVEDELRAGKAFDFIILSFADAKSRIEFIGCELPRLLYREGRIFVIDNNIPLVRRLADFGFRQVGSTNNSGIVCLMFGHEAHSSDSD